MTSRLATFKRNWEAWALASLLLAHITVGIYWSAVIPIWESHDEDAHYYFVRYLATERRLPLRGERSPAPEYDELHQPPLYYILAALPVALINLDGAVLPTYNPYASWPMGLGGLNKYVHDPVAEAWPWHGTALAVHLARLVSVALGALTLVFAFLAARRLFPEWPAARWGAVLILAFWPQFRFMTAVINNDNLVILFAAAVMWLLVRFVTAEHPTLLDLLALCVATGLALLSKSNALALVPVVAAVVLGRLVAPGRASRRRLALSVCGASLAGVVVVGWWYARNVASGAGLFGGYRSLELVAYLLGPLLGQRQFQWDLVLPALRHGLISVWAGFGWNNVGLPLPLYWAVAVFAGLASLGAILWLLRRPPRAQIAGLAALLLFPAVFTGMNVFYWVSSKQTAMQGRYMLPALAAVCIILAVGWDTLLPRHVRPAGWVLVAGGLGALAVLTPVLYIQPAYASVPQLSEAEAAAYTPLHVTLGDFAEIVGYRMDDPAVDAAGSVQVRMAWRVLAKADADYTLAVKVLDTQSRVLGELDRFPGRGAFATSSWQPGTLFSDQATIPLNSTAKEGQMARIEVSLYDRQSMRPAAVRDGDGRSLGGAVVFGRIKVRGTAQQAAQAPGLKFGGAFLLTGGTVRIERSAEPQLSLDLRWNALQQPGRDYTVSVQLRNAENAIVAQVDTQPRRGSYPTSLWEPGETVADHYSLSLPRQLPSGLYTLFLCVYDAPTGGRLAVTDPQGQALANAEVAAYTLIVGEGGVAELEEGHPFFRVADS